MLLSVATNHNSVAAPTVMILVIVGGVIYTFGYLRAVMHRANKDYKATKAAVPALRKDFWSAWWKAVKVGALIFIVVLLLGAWAVREVRGNKTDVSSTVTPSPTASIKRHSNR